MFAAGDPSLIGKGAAKLTMGSVNLIVGMLSGIWIAVMGGLLWLLTGILLWIAQVNYFIQSPAVTLGWKIIRDVCNMAFVLILLAIAIGTILQQEKYHYSKLLPQFIVAAILINFSKTICGVIIDFAQVIMLTFVAAFSSSAGGNFFNLIGAEGFFADTGEEITKLRGFDGEGMILTSYIISAGFMTIAVVVVFVMIMVLIARIVMIWFFVVLSPFAFLLSILPSTQKYAEEWWKEFTNHVIVGPAMAFFLWLSLAVTQFSSDGKMSGDGQLKSSDLPGGKAKLQEAKDAPAGKKVEERSKAGTPGVTVTKFGTIDGMISYLLGIGMLMGSLMVAQKLGVAGGKMAGAAIGEIGAVASGKKGFIPWRHALGEGLKTFESRMMEPWTKGGQRAGGRVGQFTDTWVGKTRQGAAALFDKTPLKHVGGNAIGALIGGTKADRARWAQRGEHFMEEDLKNDMKAHAEGGEFVGKGPDELRKMLVGEKNKAKRAAIIDELNRRQALGADDEDASLIHEQYEFLHASGGAKMAEEFADVVKKNNLDGAFKAGLYDKKGKRGQRDVSKVASDRRQGKIEQLGQEHILELEGQVSKDVAQEFGFSEDLVSLSDDGTAKRAEAREEVVKAEAKEKNIEKKALLQRKIAFLDAIDHEKSQRDNIALGSKLDSELGEKNAVLLKGKARLGELRSKEESEGLTDEEKTEKDNLQQTIKKQGDEVGTISTSKDAAKVAERQSKAERLEALRSAGVETFANQLTDNTRNSKQLESLMNSLSTTEKREIEQNLGKSSKLSKEQRLVLAGSGGFYEIAFNLDDKLNDGGLLDTKLKSLEEKLGSIGRLGDDAARQLLRKQIKDLQNLLASAEDQRNLFKTQILSKGEKRDQMYKNMDRASAENANLHEFISQDNDWKMDSNQAVAWYRNAELKTATKFALGGLVDKYNTEGNEKGTAETASRQRIRNMLHKVSRQNQYVGRDGKTRDVYDIRGEGFLDTLTNQGIDTHAGKSTDELIQMLKSKNVSDKEIEKLKTNFDKRVRLLEGVTAHHKGKEIDVGRKTIEVAENAQRSYAIQSSHDRIRADELEDQDWSSESGSSDQMASAYFQAFNSEQMRKTLAVNKELVRAFMGKRPDYLEQRSNKFISSIEKLQKLSETNPELEQTLQLKVKEYEAWMSGEQTRSRRTNKGDNWFSDVFTEDETKTEARFKEINKKITAKLSEEAKKALKVEVTEKVIVNPQKINITLEQEDPKTRQKIIGVYEEAPESEPSVKVVYKTHTFSPTRKEWDEHESFVNRPNPKHIAWKKRQQEIKKQSQQADKELPETDAGVSD